MFDEKDIYYLILETFRKSTNKTALVSEAFVDLRDAISNIEDATYNPVFNETIDNWVKRQEACIDG